MHVPRILPAALFAALAAACGSGDDASAPAQPAAEAGTDAAADPDSTSPDGEAPESSVPDATEDAPGVDAGPDGPGNDAAPQYTSIGTLSVDCTVPYILDGSKLGDMTYMTSHFGDLIQQYGITGSVAGVDITQYPEKMYFGSHAPPNASPNDVVSLTQMSMASVTSPQYSVKVDFAPDTQVTTGASWTVGMDMGQAAAMVLRHPTTQTVCLLGVAFDGSLQFVSAQNATQPEGGSFQVQGSFQVAAPQEVEGLCEALVGSGMECCP